MIPCSIVSPIFPGNGKVAAFGNNWPWGHQILYQAQLCFDARFCSLIILQQYSCLVAFLLSQNSKRMSLAQLKNLTKLNKKNLWPNLSCDKWLHVLSQTTAANLWASAPNCQKFWELAAASSYGILRSKIKNDQFIC